MYLFICICKKGPVVIVTQGSWVHRRGMKIAEVAIMCHPDMAENSIQISTITEYQDTISE